MTYKEQNRVIEMPRLTCDNIDELANLYVDGELELAVRMRFEQHLKQCSSCRDSVHELEHLVCAARTMEDDLIPGDVRSRLRDSLRKRVGYDSRFNGRQLRLITSAD